MGRGGVGGQGDRGGVGAKDDAGSGQSWLGFQSRDQGGAGAASTRYHIFGLDSLPVAPTAMSCAGIQGGATGQMLVAVPHYFEKTTRITRLALRTNGTTGVAGTPRCRLGLWADGTISSGSLAGSPYPANRLAQSDPIDMLPGANLRLETLVSAVVQAGTYAWAGIVFNADAAANAHVIAGLSRNCFYPIHGFTMDTGLPTTIAQDAVTFSVGWRHAVTFVTTDDLPNPFPQSAPVLLDAGAAITTINMPAIYYGRQPA